MKVCSIHGELKADQIIITGDIVRCRLCYLENARRSYRKNREARIKEAIERTRAMRQKVKEIQKNILKTWHLRFSLEEIHLKLKQANKRLEKERERNHKNSKKRAGELQDTYVRGLISRRSKVLSAKDIPQEMVEFKKATLLLDRSIKNGKRGHKKHK